MFSDDLRQLWREVANEYLRKFCEAMEMDLSDAYWIGNDPGTIAEVGDYFVNIHEMRYLVDNNIDPDVFRNWYDYSLDIHSLQEEYKQMEGFTELRDINFESFAKGAPRPYSYTDIMRRKESLNSIRKAKEDFLTQYKDLSQNGK